MKVWVALAGLLLTAATDLLRAAEPMPPGVSIRLTLIGPTFVDSRGMTLYQRNPVVEEGISPCPDLPETVMPIDYVGYNQVEEFPMRVPDAASRRSCTQKYPPFLAGADAKPIGHWTIHVRANGVRQWAYRGKPLHFSIKDKAAGEVNAAFIAPPRALGWGLAAPLPEAPAGVQTRLTSRGLAFTSHEGRPLYHPARGSQVKRTENMTPFMAPVAALAEQLPAEWSIIKNKGKLPQWAWKGQPLYTYTNDNGTKRPFVDTFGDTYGKPIAGWQVALAKAASPPPAAVRVAPYPFPRQKIYTDTRGKPLYVISCDELTRDRLDCDDIGDSPRNWLSFCAGEAHCLQMWQILRASEDAKPIDGIWSVLHVNPRHPYKPLKDGEPGVPVWMYQGRFVFTLAEDEKSTDARGTQLLNLPGMAASLIPAFAATE